ncbi:flagellar outer dynein arm light chain 2 [Coccomyxa subellipsoidea C-169]|uniref:Flagellar outer dynein arm light chain 2 n=1 Tax=Coccomyxa subellipsoidea (strain C-169) TaxID=574566 RepID=I0YQX7_COCSC|nr:flagellar outer dynein arm light chain 2 [Coccomyxa subellipsoidea C-169]EIE20796.1 flagellar outer dynein arm light chain 2 [Coccomyxa subellipsoidea C-169]|eukprot:XP_005645340.1 flagellar outer dynein arm light chain 2 [Coccomyxa subellipsoidea C-169]
MDDTSSVVSAPQAKQIVHENTYITSPEGYGETFVFKPQKVKEVLKRAIKEKMEGQAYDPVKGSQQAKQLAEVLREHVKALGFDRHKLIIQVTLGQKAGQAQNVASRCLWDPHTDGAVSEEYQNESLYCLCQVYCLYFQ